MQKYKVKVSKKGQIAIPQQIRKKLSTNIVELEMDEDKIILTPSQSILSIGGSLKKYAEKNSKTARAQDEELKAWEKHVKEKFDRS